MPKVAKKQVAARAKVDRAKKFTLAEACALVKQAAPAKFDETVDIAVRLGVNPRHADQMVIKPGTDADKVQFGSLSVTGGIVNAYNAVRMAEDLSRVRP